MQQFIFEVDTLGDFACNTYATFFLTKNRYQV